MSEDFDELLSGVVDAAGGAARTPGAAAARKRGRQRRNRQRLAASALTVAVLGGAGSVAAFSLQYNGSAGKVPAADSSRSARMTVRVASPSPSPSDSASTVPTAPTTSSPSTSTSQTHWSALPTGWLSPSNVPLDSTLYWTGGASSTAQSSVALMSESPILYPCTDAADGYPTFSKDVVGFAMNGFTATRDVSSAVVDGTPGASQKYVLYGSVSAAQAAYGALVKDVAGCSTLKGMTDAFHVPSTQVATTTATVADGVAYTLIFRTDQGKPAQVNGNYGGDSDYHAYIVRSGNLIEIVYLAGGAVVDDSGHDAAALETMIGALG